MMIPLRKLFLSVLFFPFCLFSIALAQENCKNGIDDDGDGLIDLNDATDCTCPGGVTIPSLIPNASFEQMNCCPSSYSQVNCATGWIQASSATSDYMNTCGMVFNAATAAGLVPFPDGNGILGTIFSPGWQEYVGSCLLQPLNAGTSYTLNMNIASTPIDGYGEVCNGGAINFGPINITLYGSANCSDMPFAGSDCPPAQWQVVGSALYNPVSSWGNLAITFTPSFTVNAVVFGSPCPLPSDYNNPGGCYPYFYYDNLILNSTNLMSSITETGSWCSNNVQLTGSSTPSATYQWYLNGVALVGQTSLTLNISSNGLGPGKYSLLTDSAGYCTVANDSVSPGNTVTADFTPNEVCFGAGSAFSDNSSIPSGSITGWQWNFGDPGSGANNTSAQQNPSHSFTSAGNFTVTLIATANNGCKDTAIKNVVVNTLPVAGFSVANACQNAVSTFSNSSTGTITTYSWNFGDGVGTSAQQNPTYTYSTYGTYTVSLTVTSDKSCTATVTQSAIVNPLPNPSFSSTSVCLNQATVFTNSSNIPSGSITSYSWDFGGGSTSAQQNPSFQFLSDGTFPVTLTAVSNNNCTASVTNNITVFPLPAANFTFAAACPSDTVFFTDASTVSSGSVSSWNWNFDSGAGSSALQNPGYVYSSPGVFSTSLIATTNNGCKDTIILPVTMFDKPVADFSIANVCYNVQSLFYNQSTIASGSLTNAFWTFGDGVGTSVQPSPGYTYSSPGTYSVSLIIVSNNGCSDTTIKSTVVNPLPVANFSASNVCHNDSVNFTNLSTISSGSVNNFNWSFGDMTTSNLEDPSHLYSNPGTYSVLFIINSDSGCTASLAKDVSVNPLPLADFTAANVCLDYIASFTNTSNISMGNIVNWAWSFGDGNNSNDTMPTHQYANDGVYNVALVAISDSGCIDTVFKQIEIYPEPIAAFTTGDTCRYNAAQFNNSSTVSTGTINSSSWNFGDGFTSSSTNPSHQFNPAGTYNITLTVATDNGCVDSAFQAITIFPVPNAGFTTTDVCQYTTAQFNSGSSSISTGSISAYQWDFGDVSTSGVQNPSHNYASEGSYIVELTVTSDNGCKDSIEHTILIYPIPQADFSFTNVCLYDQIQFSNNSTITGGGSYTSSWNFGDTGTSTITSPSHQYASSGQYTVTLIVTSLNGCIDTIVKQDTIYPLPVSDFTLDNNDCVNDSAKFTDISTVSPGTITAWSWNFGDSGTSSSQNPIHLYSAAGTYDVQFIVTTSDNCSDTILKTIDQHPIPTANFATDSVCRGNITNFSDLSNGNGDSIDTWIWNFGDASPLSNAQNPTHTYTNDGNYSITLIVQTTNNCIDDSMFTIPVYPLPVANFSNDIVCLNAGPTSFMSTSSVTSGLVNSWNWDFGDNTTGTGQSTNHTYLTAGDFSVQLSVTTDKNCTHDTILTVKVRELPLLYFFEADKTAGCDPWCVQFTGFAAAPAGDTISSYFWEFGDGGSSTDPSPYHCFSPAGDYDAQLTVTSSKGCIKDSLRPKWISVYPNPEAGFVLSPDSATIMYPQIDFTDMSSGANKFYWDFGDLSNAIFQNPVHEYSDTGTFVIMQIVKNQFGCSDTIFKTVVITPEFSLYIPNAFTPDGDEINDNFFPEGMGFKSENYALYIFDRWGDLIYETHNPNGFWDGKLNGQPAKQDVYVYLLELEDFTGKPYKFIGRVTLLRR